MRNHIIFFSGGKSSFAVADWVKCNYPNDNILLYFTDTLWESPDLYRFIREASDKLQLPLLTHSSGLNPMQLMFEKKMVYNSRIGDCSKLLKMRVASNFLKKGIRPEVEVWRNKELLRSEDLSGATLYFGIGFDEMHRQDAIVENWKPFTVEMPLIDNYVDNNAVLKKYGIRQPSLYDLGFAHNNCNGRCVKAGQGHYKNLKEKMPEVFKELMEQEHHMMLYVSSWRFINGMESDGRDGFTDDVKQQMLQELDEAYRGYFYGEKKKPDLYIHPAGSSVAETIKLYSFMKRDHQPYMIRDLHYDVERELKQIDLFDIGGCGCFVNF
jgi:hypothetical protein